MQTALDKLLRIMEQLRNPETGCAWDSVQNFKSLIPYIMEESYEVIEAIEQNNPKELKAELGDLLYQIVFLSQLGKEEGHFDFNDVCQDIGDKLIRRHPHVFNVQEQKIDHLKWEDQKNKERQGKSLYSVLDDIPQVLPALMRSQKIQKRCANVGFDWKTLPPVLDKIYEEIDEVMVEVNKTQPEQDRIEDEMGDLLFACVNLSRHVGVNAEIALKRACDKFERRFRRIEELLTEQGKTPKTSTLSEMDWLWDKVKREEKV